MKMIQIIIAMLIAIPIVYASMSCTITKSACTKTDVFHMSAGTNAHAEKPTESNYAYNVCCNLSNSISLNTSCTSTNSVGIINLSSSTNAHAEKPTEAKYSNSICLTPSSGTISCTYTSTTCSQACLGKISGNTNAHIENCTAGKYTTFVCCSHTVTTTPVTSGGGATGGGGQVILPVKDKTCDGEWVDGICIPTTGEKEQQKKVSLDIRGLLLIFLISVFIFMLMTRIGKSYEKIKKKLKNKNETK